MRIYLDQSVIQDLKRSAGDGILPIIETDNKYNVYCFSEAHLYDLRRDQGPDKFDDMELLEKVAGNNCVVFENDKVEFRNFTPREYYDRFDWTIDSNPLQSEDSILNLLLQPFRAIPFDLTSLIKDEQLIADLPVDLKDVFFTTTTYYDFFENFLELSNNLGSEQKKFRSLLQYLHKQKYFSAIFNHIGIKGYDGFDIVDNNLFLETFGDFCSKMTHIKSTYNWFLTVYYCLEFLGIVKGKPQKQKMHNLINDARHAFFGCYFDLMVSSDEDFLKKTAFIYKVMGLNIAVLNFDEFKDWIRNYPHIKNNATAVIDFIKSLPSQTPFEQRSVNGIDYTSYDLPGYIFHYFNIFTAAFHIDGAFFYLSLDHRRFSNGTLHVEFNTVIKLISQEFGEDLQRKGAFLDEEKELKKWPGRAWYYDGWIVELLLDNGLHLKFTIYSEHNDE